jgi:hypothetical protein
MFTCEVVENIYAFKPGQKDDSGIPLPLGSIQVRMGSTNSNIGQVRNVFARPLHYNKRIPLIGEIVLIVSGPSNDWSSSSTKNVGFYYLAVLNSTDDLTYHVFPNLFKRNNNVGGTSAGDRNYDKAIWARTFKDPKRVFPLQPFEGDDLFEGRTGQSIRFTSTILGDDSVYDKKATWKGSVKNDPLMILRIKKPDGQNVTIPSLFNLNQGTNKYQVEDIDKDESSIYLTSTQKLVKLKGGFDKNLTVKQVGTFSTTSQIVINSGRVVINALKDKLLLVGKEQVIVTGKEVIFQSDKYNVNLDDLIDYIKAHVDELADLTSGTATFSTAAGPTGPATNLSKVLKLKTADFQKFKLP